MTPRRVSVVINTLNRISTLPDTLRALQCLRWPEVEVVVVNGPSDDGTEEHLELFWSGKLKVASCPVANLSISRNIGIRQSSGDIVAFIDDDGIPEPDWLDRLIPPYDDPMVGAVGGWVRDKSGVKFQAKHIRSERIGTSASKLDVAVHPDERSVVGLIGVNSSIRRSVAERIGGFDERYAYFLDETDLVVRVQDAGYKVLVVPEAEVHHKYASSHVRPTDRSKVTMVQTAFSTAYYCMRHGPTLRASLEEKFDAVADVERHLQQNVTWRLEAGELDPPTAARLRNEISTSVSNGVAAYFEGPRLMAAPTAPPAFLPLSRTSDRHRLRLAFVSETFFPRRHGGVAVILSELARELALRGHEVTLVTRGEGATHSVDYEDGVWVHRLPVDADESAGPLDFPSLPGGPTRFARQVLAELDRVNPHRNFSCVIGTIWDLDLAATIASRRYRVGMYLVTSYLLALNSKPEWREKAEYFQNHVLKMAAGEKWALGAVDRVYASTNAILNDVRAAYCVLPEQLAPVALIPFGLPDYVSASSPRDAGRLVITFVGRLERRKGIDLLLNALPAIMTEFETADVRIVGEDFRDPLVGKTFVQQFAERHAGESWFGRVKFVGYVDEEGLRSEFEQCDVFVAPSRYESFGLIYLEAMRAGKPCVAIRAGGVPEVVEDGVTGRLVEPSEHAIARALAELLRDSKLRKAMGDAGRKRFEEKFSLRAFAEHFERDVASIAR
jgi:glycosyltransferase involved in cell wall biosynthesis/GT2 family glycosyltransferase